MPEDEPKVTKKKIPIRNFWKRYQVVGHTEVASGPLPKPEELSPQEEPEQAPTPASPTYPAEGTIRTKVPMGSVPKGDQD